MRCPRCGAKSEDEWYCARCGAHIRESPGAARVRASTDPGRGILWFAGAFVGIHAAALLLLTPQMSLWQGLGIASASSFLIGLLAGALRAMNPMDADALGEPIILPSTLPGRYAPVLLLATFFGMVATPIVGLGCYLVLAYAKACVDHRVVAVFGLTALKSVWNPR